MSGGGAVAVTDRDIVQALRRAPDIGRVRNADGINLSEREQRLSPCPMVYDVSSRVTIAPNLLRRFAALTMLLVLPALGEP